MKRKNQTISKVKRLKELHRQIVDGYKTTEELIRSSKDRARDALKEAILVGNALLEVKQIVGHGGFWRWIKKNCKGVQGKTASNYIRLAQNSQHVTNLTRINLRSAYISIGIIKEESDAPTQHIALPETSPIEVESVTTTRSKTYSVPTTNGKKLPVIEVDEPQQPTIPFKEPKFKCPNCGFDLTGTFGTSNN